MVSLSYHSLNRQGRGTEIVIEGLVDSGRCHAHFGNGGDYMELVNGRSVYGRLEAGRTVKLRALTAEGEIRDVRFCIQFVSH